MPKGVVLFALLLGVIGSDAEAIGSEFQVNTYTNNIQGFHHTTNSVAPLKNGGFVVTWDSKNQDSSGYGVYAQRYDSNSNPVGTEIPVNTYTTGDQSMCSVEGLANGGFVVVWRSLDQEDDSGYGIFGQKFDSEGNRDESEFRINTYKVDHQNHPFLTKTEEGFIVTWVSRNQVSESSEYDVYAQRFNTDFSAIEGEFRVNSETGASQDYAAASGLEGGGFVIVWMSNGHVDSHDVVFQLFDGDGETIESEVIANTYTAGEQTQMRIATINAGSFVIAWASRGQEGDYLSSIRAQIFSSNDGTAIGGEFRVDAALTNAHYPSLLAVGEGFVVAWYQATENNWDVFAQRFDASGIRIGQTSQLNTYVNGAQALPSMARLGGETIVAVWNSEGQDGDSYGAFGIITCMPGFAEGANSACEPCPSDTFKNTWGVEQGCDSCPQGEISGPASAECIDPSSQIDFAYDQDAPYLAVVGVSSNDGWSVTVVYSSADTVLFLPQGTDVRVASAFPCSLKAYDASAPSVAESACCLLDFRDAYTATTAFDSWARETTNQDAITPGGQCATDSTVVDAAPASGTSGDTFGSTAISFSPTTSEAGDPDGTARAIITIPRDELGSVSTTQTTSAGDEAHLFVGLARFKSTATRILRSASQQVKLVLLESANFVVSSHGSTDYSFFTWMSAHSHRVLNTADAQADAANYATISFEVEPGLSVPSGGALIPLSSVEVDSTAQCNAYGEDLDALVGQPSCGPQVALCEPQATLRVGDRIGTLHVPLGLGTIGESVLIGFAVTLEDADGKSVTSTVEIALDTSDDATTQWCTVEDAVIADMDVTLYVGSTANADSDLSDVNEIALATDQPLVQDSFDASSVEAGLLTVVLEATNTNAQDLELTFEDVTTLHVNGDAVATQVVATLAAHPFTSDGSTLTASTEIAALCREVPLAFLNSCALRKDVTARTPAPSAYKLDPDDSDETADYMQRVAGSSAYAADLGTNFKAAILANHPGATAIWVNAAFDWAGQGTDYNSLSSEVIITALVSVSFGGATRRSMTLQSRRRASGGVTGAAVHFQVPAAALTASVLGVPPELVTTWDVKMESSPREVCLPTEDLVVIFRRRLISTLAAVASSVLDVQIASVSVHKAGVDCDHRRSLRLSSAAPSVQVEALIVMAPPKHADPAPYIDAQLFAAAPGVLAVEPVQSSPTVALTPPSDHNNNTPPVAAPPPPAASSSPVLPVVVAAVALVVVATMAALAWRRCRPQPEPVATATSMQDIMVGDALVKVEAKMMMAVEPEQATDPASSP